MLVLTRKIGQNIVIINPRTGDTYEITVIQIQGDQVRVGITAPPSVAVDRTEIAGLKALSASERPAA